LAFLPGYIYKQEKLKLTGYVLHNVMDFSTLQKETAAPHIAPKFTGVRSWP
jgi:hypothetical protein